MKLGHLLIGAALLSAATPYAFAVQATGGNTTNVIDGYRIHIFTNSATASNFVVTTGGNVEVLVVAGGGGGGTTMGGGGGAGGLIYTSSFAVVAGNYSVIVGVGGLGGYAYTYAGQTGTKGSNSSFGVSIVAMGGGGGCGWDGHPSTSGGSGGGGNGQNAYSTGFVGQGHSGGSGVSSPSPRSGGGGGGAGTAGTNGAVGAGGKGGEGLLFWDCYYAGGGGGGIDGTPLLSDGGGPGGSGGGGAGSRGTIKAIDAEPNTGGGGGGAGYNTSGTGRIGGNGGSGIVIVRYLFGIDNASGATNVTATSAWLNGTLHVDMPNTAVFVFWGLTDGGPDVSAWANTNTWAAPQSAGSFTVQATGLASDATWYYRYAVSNETGWTWALDTSVFITGEVWIENTADASEIGPTPGTFTVHRASEATNAALIVTYTVGGTATPGADYTALSGTVTIPKGAETATIEVMPIFDHFVEGTETVEVALVLGPYMIGSLSNATVDIEDYGLVTRTWNGGGADTLASNPANWVEGEAPIAGDAIKLLDDGTNKNMTWNLNLPVQSWAQNGYTGTVTIATVYPGQGAFTNFTILGDCVISNGVWTQTANPNGATESTRLRATIGGNLMIGPDGKIDVKGKSNFNGPGQATGASYGGQGRSGKPCYGSLAAPTNLGSRGDYGDDYGGGAIWLTVAGESCNDGLMRSDGVTRAGDPRPGSGGSIWLISGTMRGSGTIQANGGVSGNAAGGGRIALTVTNPGADFASYTGIVRCLGGGGAATCGTIYLRTAGQGPNAGTLIVDNANGTANRYAQIGSLVTDTSVGDVIVRNAGRLLVDTDQTLTVNGSWSNAATVLMNANATVAFAGGSGFTSTVYGATSFMRLVCTNAGQTLVFPTGVLNTIQANGAFIIRGAATATNVFLRSSVPGVAWKLKVDGAALQEVWHVDVADSDARTGAEVLAMLSHNGGNNSNWVFNANVPGGTNVWTGADSTLWSVAGNWSYGRIPFDADSVRIPPGMPHSPVVDGQSRTVAELKIETGASLSLNGFDFTVVGKAVVAGTVIAASTETLTLKGDTDFTGGAFTFATSTLLLAGETLQSVNLSNLSFYTIRAQPNTDIVFEHGFSAFQLLCTPGATETSRLTFADGETVAVSWLTLLSVPGTTNIVMRSAPSGDTWGLNVLTNHTIRGVDVMDCDASAGKTLVPSGSRNGGNNLNWDFGGPWMDWTDQSGSGKFEDAANWVPAGVPGAASWVRIDNLRPMTVASTTTVDRLIVGGNSNAATATINGAVTVSDQVTVLNNGTLLWNRPGVVSNDLSVLAGGLLSHSINGSTEVNKLQLNVGGDIDVAFGGAINVTGMGYGAYNQGPGKNGSYGGRGTWGGGGPCYGSIVAPTNLGSSGDTGYGGGAIIATAQGAIRNDGLMCADGSGSRSGAGGSIWLTSGTLTGGGAIRANGGSANPAGGGRVALVVTNSGADFSLYTGLIQAHGPAAAGAGTIYYQTASDLLGRGTVEVNDTSTVGITQVPPTLSPDVREAQRASFKINAAKLQLTDDFIVGDIWLDTANAVLDLGGYTLTVNAREHELGLGNVVNPGAIVWMGLPPGVLIIVK